MSKFIQISNSNKVIDRFGRKVIHFKTSGAAADFVVADGVGDFVNEITHVTDATDEDRIDAGLPIAELALPLSEEEEKELKELTLQIENLLSPDAETTPSQTPTPISTLSPTPAAPPVVTVAKVSTSSGIKGFKK